MSCYRYSHVVSCDDFNYFNETTCESIVQATPACLDALQLAEEQPTVPNRVDAAVLCERVTPWMDDTTGKNPYDARLNVSFVSLMDKTELILGV